MTRITKVDVERMSNDELLEALETEMKEKGLPSLLDDESTEQHEAEAR